MPDRQGAARQGDPGQARHESSREFALSTYAMMQAGLYVGLEPTMKEAGRRAASTSCCVSPAYPAGHADYGSGV